MNIEHLKDQHGSVKIGQKSESIGIRGPLGMASSNNVHRYGFDLFQKVLGPGSSPGPTPGLIESQISNASTYEGSHFTATKRPNDDSFEMSPIKDMLSHLVDIF